MLILIKYYPDISKFIYSSNILLISWIREALSILSFLFQDFLYYVIVFRTFTVITFFFQAFFSDYLFSSFSIVFSLPISLSGITESLHLVSYGF